MHVRHERLHAYVNRGLDIRIAVATSEDTGDFTNVTFRTTGIEKTALTPVDTESGFDVDLTLTAAELNTVGTFRWELLATFGGQVRTIAQGPLTVSPEPTQEEA